MNGEQTQTNTNPTQATPAPKAPPRRRAQAKANPKAKPAQEKAGRAPTTKIKTARTNGETPLRKGDVGNCPWHKTAAPQTREDIARLVLSAAHGPTAEGPWFIHPDSLRDAVELFNSVNNLADYLIKSNPRVGVYIYAKMNFRARGEELVLSVSRVARAVGPVHILWPFVAAEYRRLLAGNGWRNIKDIVRDIFA